MSAASWLLGAIGILGAFDIAYFHTWKGRLTTRPESRNEAVVHVLRGFCYAAQFVVVPSVTLTGGWWFALLGLFVIDAAIAVTDVLLEPASRKTQGGLAAGEYLIHVVLSVLVGALLCAVFSATWGDWAKPAAVHVAWNPAMALMAIGAAGVSVVELAAILTAGPARPLHIRVRLRTSLQALWDFTQDHVQHPSWDHRFSHIEMLADEVKTGTTMRYEKTLLGLTIRGFGRYKLHKPMQQSTFEFWSDDPRSLIRRGVGLWRYTPVGEGVVEFATSYTYDVRWGLLGRVIDRLIFRPAMQAYTEQSFRRLARDHFPAGASRVLGARRGKPLSFAGSARA